jgi:Flp pilus assembly protein TadG
MKLSTRATRSSGQALVEFALVLPLMMTIIISVLNFMPAVTTRGVTLDVSETALEIATRYIPAVDGDAASDRTVLCNQLLDVIRSEIVAALTDNLPNYKTAGSPVAGGANQGCAAWDGNGKLTPTPDQNPVVYVQVINSGGQVQLRERIAPTHYANGVLQPVRIKVCVSYTWTPDGGLEYLALHGPVDLSQEFWNAFTYHFCGNDLINPNRSQ